MNKSEQHGTGMTGLVNMGNTCYINSFIQILNHTYELGFIFEDKHKKNRVNKSIPESTILSEWYNLKEVMFSKNGVVSPSRFIQYLRSVAVKKNNELFSGDNQNDLVEFVHFVIECMHKSISRGVIIRIAGTDENDVDRMAVKCYTVMKDVYSKEYSEIMKLYYGMYVSVISSHPNNVIHSMKPEMYSTIDLPIPINATTIYECFDEFIRPELMSGDNAWFNESTNMKEDVCKRMTFWNFPNIMIITLKRFSPCGTAKNHALIKFPLKSLNLTKYVSGYKSTEYVYDLFGVCNHMGTMSQGHYTAFVYNSANKWCHFNDNIVEDVNNGNDVITSSAYCLFYRKK